MVSWRNKTLQFLCLFLCRIHLTKAGCDDYFKSIDAFVSDIKLENFTQTIPLVDASNLKEMMICTLKKEEKNRPLRHLLRHCIGQNNLKEDSSCGMEFFGHVSFFDFMCLVATAFNKTIGVCSHEVVIKLYSKFGMITATTIPTTLPTTTSTTTLPTTEQPQTTAKLKTTTIKSTATRTCPPTVTASSTSPTTTTTRSLSSEGNVHRRSMVNDPTDKVVTDTVVYTILGLSFILNLLLAFSVAILCQRRYSHGASMNPWPVPISEEDVTTKQVQNSISQTQGKCSAEEWTSSQSHLHVSETMNCSGSESRVKVLNSNRNSACTRPGAQCMSEEDDW